MDNFDFIKFSILIFFIYSVIGWVIEVVLKYIEYHGFVNRGFLIGPYCPVYGFGAMMITIFTRDIIGKEGNYIKIFIIGFITCGIIEYFVGYFMEHAFHARWWDYSNKPLNLHGRIWIGNLMLFGLGAVAIAKWINPIIFKIINNFSNYIISIFLWSNVIVIMMDSVISYILTNRIKGEICKAVEDNTEEIKIKIRELLVDLRSR